MTGKSNLIELYPNMTFKELEAKSEADNLKITKHDAPSFKIGASVFREIISPLNWKRYIPLMWRNRKPRNLIIHLNGANSCFELDVPKNALESFKHHLWSPKEKEKWMNKLLAKSKAEQKIISTTQFYVLVIMLGIIAVLQILTMRGMPVF